jgi:hypothetical protein
VSIDESEPIAAHTAQREHGSEQNAAVPAEHNRKLARPKMNVQAIGKPAGVFSYRLRVEYAVALLPLASVVSRWHNDAALACAQTLQQSLIPQSTGQLVATRNRARDGWSQAKVGRGIEEDDLPHDVSMGVTAGPPSKVVGNDMRHADVTCRF